MRHQLTIIGSDNGSASARRQAIIWLNAGTLLIGPLGTLFSDILIEMSAFSFNEIYLKSRENGYYSSASMGSE